MSGERNFLVTIGLGKEAYEVLDVRYEPSPPRTYSDRIPGRTTDTTYFLVYRKSGFDWVNANTCKLWRYS